MDFTFGIITGTRENQPATTEAQLHRIIDSIEAQNIPHYDIVIVGNCNISRKNTVVHSFDESVKPAWITRKKNIITYYALHENIVFLHDYIYLDPNWYAGYLKLGNNWSICSNPTLDCEGQRWIDWSLWWEDVSFIPGIEQSRQFMLPYDVQDLSQFMYIGGSYWVAKKKVMQEFPLDENLVWGQGEDVEWSKRVRSQYPFTCNPDSIVRFTKPKGNPFSYATPEIIATLRSRI